MTPLLLAFRL